MEREHWSFEPDSSEPVTPFRLTIVILPKLYHGRHDHKCKTAPRQGARLPDPYRAGYFLFGGERNTITPSDQRKIKCLKDQVKEHDQEFEKRHIEVLDFIEEEDQAALDSEEKVFVEHVNRVSDIIERLEDLSQKFWSPKRLGPGGKLFRGILVRRWRTGPP